MQRNKLLRGLGICFWSLLYVGFCVLVFSFYRADVKSRSSKDALETGATQEALVLADNAVALNPFEPAYYRWRAKANLLESIYMSPDEREATKDAILADLEKSRDLNPENLATLRNNISLYYFLALQDTSEESPVDEEFLSVTRAYYASLKEAYSTDLGVLTSVAHYENRLGLTKESEVTENMIRSLRPEILEWHPLLR